MFIRINNFLDIYYLCPDDTDGVLVNVEATADDVDVEEE